MGHSRCPRFGTSYSGLDTRVDLEPDIVRVRRFEILDENGEQLAVAGQLAVHERQVGAVDFTLESQDFEIIDNELGDVGVGTNLNITGELTRPKLEGDIRVTAGRLELDRILRLFYDPYRVEALPEVVSAASAVETAGSAQEATQAALARAGKGAAPAEAVAPVEAPPPPASLFENVALDLHVRIPDNLVLRGDGTPAGRTDAGLDRRSEYHARRRPERPQGRRGTDHAGGNREYGARHLPVPGTSVRSRPERHASLHRRIGVQPPHRRHRDAQDPEHGSRSEGPDHRTLQKPEIALSSTPPLEESDVLALIVFNRPINELGTGERASLAATAGGIATGFIATPLGESIGRALDLDIFEVSATSEGEPRGRVDDRPAGW